MATLFSELPIPAAQLANLTELGYLEMTPIQAQALPHILKGKDVLGRAQTGSGKTAAFGIGLLSKINPELFSTQALVLCPTRELADQVSKELRRLARYMPNVKILSLCGGQPIAAQVTSLAHAPHIAVGTPGRILDHLERDSLSLSDTKVVVLDEGDRMLDMGFADEMDAIIPFLPSPRQTLMFSATYPEDIEAISQLIQTDPLMITIDERSQRLHIEQYMVELEKNQRLELVAQLLSKHQPESCVVFCNTKSDCQKVEAHLNQRNMDALALHGDLEQRDRDQVLLRFANHSCRVLVATDVAARGLDIPNLAMVINYELAHDPEIYVHRIGRTGRAGEKGLAVSFVTPAEMNRALAVEAYMERPTQWVDKYTFADVKRAQLRAPMATLCIDGGKKDKIRAGDILGALTNGEEALSGDEVGKIDVYPMHVYVAVTRSSADRAIKRIRAGKIKGKTCRVRVLTERL
ncbi:ATP-dependent RNA helicase DbpA [Neisseriaceae bacterium CLB008]|nr:ATP-dependent RNA helicase DbpA [Neisseriaceae bacterium]